MKTRHGVLIGLMVIIGIGRLALHKSPGKYDNSRTIRLTPEEQEKIKRGDVLDLLREDNPTVDSMMEEIRKQKTDLKIDPTYESTNAKGEKTLTARGQMLQMMGNDEIEELLDMLDASKVRALKGQIEAANQNFKSKTISYEEWAVERNKVNIALYPMLPVDTDLAIKDLDQVKIRNMVTQGEIEEAVDLLLEWGYEDHIKAKARLIRAKKANQQGLIGADMLRVIYARVRQYLVYTV